MTVIVLGRRTFSAVLAAVSANHSSCVPLSPQPSVLWEVNSDVCSIDQSGNITRRVNNQVVGYDSNGVATTGHAGQLVQVTATVLRQDGSKSGVLGTLNVAIQNAAPRQSVLGSTQYAAASPVGTHGYYDLVGDLQPPVDHSA